MAKEYAKRFYQSRAWRSIRDKVFKDNHGICEQCGGLGLIVHHKKPITPQNINDINITLNEDNLQLLCIDCHNAIDHNKLINGEDNSLIFDANGDYMPPI